MFVQKNVTANNLKSMYSNSDQFFKSKDTDDRGYNKEIVEDMIAKGEISDAIGRGYGSGSEPMKFVKTGKEVKEHLPAVITQLMSAKASVLAQMDIVRQAVGIDPTDALRASLTNQKIAIYPYKMCDAPYNDSMGKYEDRTDENVLCEKHNNLAYMLRDIEEDLATCQVVMTNATDTQKYTLSVSQLIALNFQ